MRTSEDWPELRHPSRCSCARCGGERRQIERLANRSLSAALRHAQNRAAPEFGAEAETPAGAIVLPGRFSGWQGAVDLPVLFGPNPPIAFTQKNVPRLYRIYHTGSTYPLYIGMAFRASISDRVLSHVRTLFTQRGAPRANQTTRDLAQRPLASTLSEIERLRILLADYATMAAGTIPRVAYGEVTPAVGYRLDPKLLHAFEAALQILEKPQSYVGSSRAFEDTLEDAIDVAMDDPFD